MIYLPTKIADTDEIICQEAQLHEWGVVKQSLVAIGDEALGEFCRTFWHDDKPVAIVGVLRKWSNHWHGFAVLGEYVVKHPYRFCIMYRRLIDYGFDVLEMDRLEVTAACGDPVILRMSEFLGFEVEGKLRRYGLAGEDAWILSRVAESVDVGL